MERHFLRTSPLVALVAAILCVLPATASAVSTGDGTWHWQNPLPQGNKLLAVDFVDASTGWAVGQSGTIINTADGGATWTGQASDTTWDLTGVCFTDQQHGWVIGQYEDVSTVRHYQDHRVMLHTSDGGATWRHAFLPGSHSPYLPRQVCFVDESHGWVLGKADALDSLIHTEDGGQTWEFQTVHFWQSIEGIAFTSATRGYAVSRSKVYRTDDGGDTWQMLRDDTAAMTTWSCVNAVGDKVWVCSASFVYDLGAHMIVSTDAGETWSTIASPPSMYAPPSFVNATEGWALSQGPDRGIVHTYDGGATWTNQYSDLFGEDGWNMDPLGLAVQGADPTHAFVVGSFGAVTATSDGSAWGRFSSTTSTADLSDVSFPDAQHGWAVGDHGGVIHTADGGRTWDAVAIDGLYGASCVTFFDADHGWIGIGGNWSHDDGAVLRTTDGGATWDYLDTYEDLLGMGVFKLQFFDTQNGWALLDYGGTLAETHDGGVTWQLMDMETTGAGMRHTIDFAFTDPQHGCIIGTLSTAIDGTTIGCTAYTDDGGETWHPDGVDWPSSDGHMTRVAFGDALHGWVVGDNRIWRTEDGGVTWVKLDLAAQTPPLTPEALAGPYLDVAAIDGDSAVVVARNGAILRSDDAGLTWYEQDSGRERQNVGPYQAPLLSAVCAVDEAHIWAVGGRGAVLSTCNGFDGADTTVPVTVAVDGDSTWHDRSIIDLVATDEGSGVVHTEAKVDDGDWRPGSHVTLDEGVHDIVFLSRDAAGNTEEQKTAHVQVDLHAPVTQATAQAGWTDEDVQVTLAPTDTLSGIATTRWCEYGDQPATGTFFTISANADGTNDGEHRIEYWSEDHAGNIEEVHEAVVRIDTWSPDTTTDGAGALITGPTSIGLSALDTAAKPDIESSGVAGSYYSIDGRSYREAEQTSSSFQNAAVRLAAASRIGAGPGLESLALIDPVADDLDDGTHTVSFYSVDAAGNQEAPSSITVTVDTAVMTALKNVGKTTTNKPTSSWTIPAGWSPNSIEVADAQTLADNGAFITPLATSALSHSATSFTFAGLAPLHPGTYYLHVRFHSGALGRDQWTPAKTVVVPKTATPVLVAPVSLRLSTVTVDGRRTIRVRYSVRVRDDSRGSAQIKLVQQRVAGGAVVASVTTTHKVKSPRTLGSREHTYTFTWPRPRALKGKGVYRIVATARDQEYNWSAKLTASRTTTF